MNRFLLLIVSSVSLGCMALAGGLSGPGMARPWSIEGGYFNPSLSGASDGGYFSIARVLSHSGLTEFGLESYSASYTLGIVDVTTPTLNFFGRFYNSSCTGFFFAAIGFGRADVSVGPFTGSTATTSVFTIGGAMMTGPNTYAIARIQSSSVTAMEGFSLGYGYRF